MTEATVVPTWEYCVPYAVTIIKKNVWRTMPDYDHDDLMQEAFLLYDKCYKRYADRVDTTAHFCALFRTSLFNRITHIAKQRTKHAVLHMLPDESESGQDLLHEPAAPDTLRELELALDIEAAPAPVQQLIRGRRKSIKTYVRRRGSRETGNERLCRMAGLDPQVVNLRKLWDTWFHGPAAAYAS